MSAGENPDEPERTHYPDPLDGLIEAGGVLDVLRQRLHNLEQFRSLYLNLQEETEVLLQKNQSAEPKPQTTHNEFSQEYAEYLELENLHNEIDRLNQQIREHQDANQALMDEIEDLHSKNQQLSHELSQTAAVLERLDETTDQPVSAPDEVQRLQDEINHTQELAFGAMRANADLGGVIYMLTNSFQCKTANELGELAATTLNNYQLKGIVSLSHNNKKQLFSNEQHINPLLRRRLENPSKEARVEKPGSVFFYTLRCQLVVATHNDTPPETIDALGMLVNGLNAGAERIFSEAHAIKERENLKRLAMTTQKKCGQH